MAQRRDLRGGGTSSHSSHEERVDIAPEEDPDAFSDEDFDRLEYAEQALMLVRPKLDRLVVSSARRGTVQIESGPLWGKTGANGKVARWAMMIVPPRASRRAIALAAASIGGTGARPWALDTLFRSNARDIEERYDDDPEDHER